MSTLTIKVPSGYAWVVGIATALPLLTFWQMSRVVQARKKSGIRYPQLYATKEEQEKSKDALKFNCAQRAHQNTLENLTQVFIFLLISGLKTPRLSAVSGAIWIVGRVIYTLGYSSGLPKNRMTGSLINYTGLVTLMGSSIYTAYSLLKEINFQF